MEPIVNENEQPIPFNKPREPRKRNNLSLTTIGLLTGGAVAAQFDDDLKRAVKDCEDRPTDKRARVVALIVKLNPEVDMKSGKVHCEDVAVEMQIKTGLPQRHSPVYRMKPKADGVLMLPEEEDLGPGLFDDEIDSRKMDHHP